MTNEYAKITMLGTGNAMCVRCYNTCFCLHSPQSLLMVDAGGGNGIFRQLHRARIPFEDIHHLFVTHTHTDHIMGVVWMIRKISPLIHKGKYQPPFTIYTLIVYRQFIIAGHKIITLHADLALF